jgi:hypothetical protein
MPIDGESTRSRVVFLHIFTGDQIKLILLTKISSFYVLR